MKVELGETGLARRLRQKDAGLVLRRKKVAPAAQTAECIVLKQHRHDHTIGAEGDLRAEPESRDARIRIAFSRVWGRLAVPI